MVATALPEPTRDDSTVHDSERLLVETEEFPSVIATIEEVSTQTEESEPISEETFVPAEDTLDNIFGSEGEWENKRNKKHHGKKGKKHDKGDWNES